MKYIIEYRWRVALMLTIFLAASCETDVVKPILSDDASFTAPAINNTATSGATVLLAENVDDPYETITWTKSAYDGLDLGTTYTVEIDNNDDFSSSKVLATTIGTSTSITVGQLNDMMLSLGMPGFQEGTVHIRVKSVITGQPNAPLISAAIQRVATTFQNSECGAYCTVGLIGSASPGGWDVDVDMRLADATKVDKRTWTTTVKLATGEVKFRAQDGWDVNWGAAAFPTGNGVGNGPNIPIATAGYYKITFNDETGAYTFQALTTPEYATVGVIGPAQAGGWDTDTDMVKDATDPHLWTATLTLTDGEAKFRADNAWTMNWGGATALSGWAVKDGPNVPVTGATYVVTFNDATGEYALLAQNFAAPYPKMGLIGPAQAGGWDTDTDLTQNPANPFRWSKILTITQAEAKFRANDNWDANWGGTTFPSGKGTGNGPNIPAKAGTYFITFHSGTGEYTFLK